MGQPREIERWLWRDTRGRRGGGRARFGAVTVVQRFGGSLNLHVHLHVLALDGVYEEGAGASLRWVAARPPSAAALAEVTERVAQGCERAARRWLARHRAGAGVASDDVDAETVVDAMEACRRMGLTRGSFVRGDGGSARDAAAWTFRLAAPRRWGAAVRGFDLHAGVCVEPGKRDVLELLCRYVLRPPFALERLRVVDTGRVEYRCKDRPGSPPRVRVMTPAELIARLAALVPPPRYPDVRYHGVLAPGAPWRSRVVPAPRVAAGGEEGACGGHGGAAPRGASAAAAAERAPSSDRIPWAELLRRIHGIDALRCPACDGRMKVIAVLIDAAAVRAVLVHIGPEGTGPPRAATARSGRGGVAVGQRATPA